MDEELIFKSDVEGHSQVLFLLDEVGKATLSEMTETLPYSKKKTAKLVGTLENVGMLRGEWDKNKNNRWVRYYFISGEGTSDYIKVLRKHLSSKQTNTETEK